MSVKPAEISAVAAAERLGITQQALGMWCKRPGAPARVAGNRVFVQWPDFARWREQQLVEQAKKEATADGDFEQHRTRKMAAEASLAEMELAKAQGQLVSVDEFGDTLGRVLDRLMARLRSLPPRLAHHSPEVETDLEREIEELITELHNMDDDAFADPSPDTP